ncbi:rps8a [Ecytonucleospora hepatopenaei]|uniref:40S ribosomal protein S8 n=1 Tax=Ecytonucleospora hepatopenaei TaxID=646526 RepID=A0A1W0E301_9MICR|nr:rps8a [Ecytonucleospora hepatopenaei]
MGITRCGRHKKNKSGGARNQMQKKRKNMMGRQPANTKIGEERIKALRVRGGNFKQRALRLNEGLFSYFNGSEQVNDVKCKIEQVIYHPSNNELMRTNTLTKSAVVKISTEGIDVSSKVIQEKDKVLQVMKNKGFFYAIIDSRPGQEGVANGHVLQGAELEFYQNKLKKGKIDA